MIPGSVLDPVRGVTGKKKKVMMMMMVVVIGSDDYKEDNVKNENYYHDCSNYDIDVYSDESKCPNMLYLCWSVQNFAPISPC